jgi:hypothetical protein
MTIKVSGKMAIQKALALGQQVKLGLIGAIVKVETFDNQNNTQNVCYVFKATDVEVM